MEPAPSAGANVPSTSNSAPWRDSTTRRPRVSATRSDDTGTIGADPVHAAGRPGYHSDRTRYCTGTATSGITSVLDTTRGSAPAGGACSFLVASAGTHIHSPSPKRRWAPHAAALPLSSVHRTSTVWPGPSVATTSSGAPGANVTSRDGDAERTPDEIGRASL